jgi:hypothetical protein
LPLHQMQAWQLQDRHLLAEQQVSPHTCRCCPCSCAWSLP